MEDSPRVRGVKAAALQLVTRVLLNFELSDSQAFSLASDSSISETFGKLKERMESGIVRGTAHVARDRDFQKNLAVHEVALGQRSYSDTGATLRDFVRDAVTERDNFLQEQASWTSIYDEVIRESRRFSIMHLHFRHFIDRCEQLRNTLSHELRIAIYDLGYLSTAQSELDRVFTRHIRRALTLIEREGMESNSA